MSFVQFMENASSMVTLLSFVTFIGIIVWTFMLHRSSDFDEIARLPLTDDAVEGERHV